jgi:serine/threonine-protein kinase RsbW
MAAAPQTATAPSGESGGGPPAGGTGAPGPPSCPGHLGASASDAIPRSPESSWRCYPGRPDQAARVRAFLAGVLAGCPAAADVVLMADELVSNAIQHSNSQRPGGTFRVRVRVQPGRSVRVEVADAGGRWARPGSEPCADDSRLGGRGLHIVGALATAWGVDGDETGRTVWCTAAWEAG